MSSILIWVVAPEQVGWNKEKKRFWSTLHPEYSTTYRRTGLLCVRSLSKTLVWGSFLHISPVITSKSFRNTSVCVKIRPESST